jgi:hypothetical protein
MNAANELGRLPMSDALSLLATRRKFRLLALTVCSGLLALAVAFSVSVPAYANCYENFGCTNSQKFKLWQLKQASCQVLYEMRNWIYKENGYCFKTPEAIHDFGNAGCKYDNMSSVPLNYYERYNVNKIVQAEKYRGCGAHGAEG